MLSSEIVLDGWIRRTAHIHVMNESGKEPSWSRCSAAMPAFALKYALQTKYSGTRCGSFVTSAWARHRDIASFVTRWPRVGNLNAVASVRFQTIACKSSKVVGESCRISSSRMFMIPAATATSLLGIALNCLARSVPDMACASIRSSVDPPTFSCRVSVSSDAAIAAKTGSHCMYEGTSVGNLQPSMMASQALESGAGNWCASTRELLVGRKATKARIASPPTTSSARRRGNRALRVAGHGCWCRRFSTRVIDRLDLVLTVPLHSKSAGRHVSGLQARASNQYGWPDYRPTEKTVADVHPAVYRSCAGEDDANGIRATIGTDGEELFALASSLGPERVRLYPSADASLTVLQTESTDVRPGLSETPYWRWSACAGSVR